MTELNKDQIMKALENVIDPEIGLPITAMELIDTVEISDGNISISFHLTSTFCPPMFVKKMAADIKTNVRKLEGVKDVQLVLTSHQMVEQLNKEINE